MIHDANRVGPKLWMGSAPSGPDLDWPYPFAVLVLCALEYQPPASAFPSVEVIHAPNDDAAITSTIARNALRAAEQVARLTRSGKCVLVTCIAGRNRSGLVAGLSMVLNGVPGGEAVKAIQRARTMGLCNPTFAAFVRDFRPERREMERRR